MLYKVYAIRDDKTDFFPPQIFANDEDAKRAFALVVNTPGNMISFAPSDFTLYRIGTFESETAMLDRAWPVLFVCNADQLVSQEVDNA